MLSFRSIRCAALVSLVCVAIGCTGTEEGLSADVVLSSANSEAVATQGVAAVSLLDELVELADGYSSVFDPAQPQTVPCDSGEVTTNVTEYPTMTDDTSVVASMNFSQCVRTVNGESATIDGSLVLRGLRRLTADPEPPYTEVWSCQFVDLTVTTADATVVFNGGFTVHTSTEDGVTFTTLITGATLSASVQVGTATLNGAISSFRIERTYNESTGYTTLSVLAAVTADAIGGTVIFQTMLPFSGTDPDRPSEGILVVTGADGTTLSITALDSVNVQLDLDLDGDGVIDETETVTWDAIDPNVEPAPA